jgi:excisionase family DNA binding protein
MTDLTKYLTVRQAAKHLDLTEERVRELINLMQIKATKVGKWRIHPDDLEKFIESRSNVNR